MWKLDTAVSCCRALETALAPNYHVALGGGVLLRGKSTHDLDVLVYPHHSSHFDIAEIRQLLKAAGCTVLATRRSIQRIWRAKGSTDQKWVEAWWFDGKRVDIIMPSKVGD